MWEFPLVIASHFLYNKFELSLSYFIPDFAKEPMTNLLKDMNFTEITETKADSKHRITLGRCSIKAHHYKIYENRAKQIVLDPQASVSASELWLFKNKKALRSVVEGLSQAKAGKLIKSTEDYSKYNA